LWGRNFFAPRVMPGLPNDGSAREELLEAWEDPNIRQQVYDAAADRNIIAPWGEREFGPRFDD
jgi:hypothetical protein